jgi:hypothetical protein
LIDSRKRIGGINNELEEGMYLWRVVVVVVVVVEGLKSKKGGRKNPALYSWVVLLSITRWERWLLSSPRG